MGFCCESTMKIAPTSRAMATAATEVRTVISKPRCRDELNTNRLSLDRRHFAAHQQAAFGAGHLPTWEIADDFALVDDHYAIGKIEDFIEIERDEQHGAALVPLVHQLAMHELDGSHVETPGRLDSQDDLWLAVELAGDDEFLLVAPGERASRGLRSRCAHVELFHLRGGNFAGARIVDAATLAEGRQRTVAEQHVLGQGKRQHQPAIVAVLADVGKPALAQRHWIPPARFGAL